MKFQHTCLPVIDSEAQTRGAGRDHPHGLTQIFQKIREDQRKKIRVRKTIYTL